MNQRTQKPNKIRHTVWLRTHVIDKNNINPGWKSAYEERQTIYLRYHQCSVEKSYVCLKRSPLVRAVAKRSGASCALLTRSSYSGRTRHMKLSSRPWRRQPSNSSPNLSSAEDDYSPWRRGLAKARLDPNTMEWVIDDKVGVVAVFYEEKRSKKGLKVRTKTPEEAGTGRVGEHAGSEKSEADTIGGTGILRPDRCCRQGLLAPFRSFSTTTLFISRRNPRLCLVHRQCSGCYIRDSPRTSRGSPDEGTLAHRSQDPSSTAFRKSFVPLRLARASPSFFACL